ncbi:MAG: Gfo/Idh/MocA family oxidoreductase [Verrucomicrobia bacterium]|nr:Gfo/Idh/MocA family oxidoreductase [Verrucomicrobiota bacterium]
MQPSSKASLTRRAFLKRTAAASLLAVPVIIPASVRGRPGAVTPNERINVGLIGRGAMGSGHLQVLASSQETQLGAVCDVDRTRREPGARQVDEICAAQRAKGAYRHCAAINNYRELLARPDIDAVLIATPDHWHSLQSIHAVTLREGREMVNTIRRYGRVFQTGTQYRSIPAFRHVCEFVRNGGLGQVKSVFTQWMKLHVPNVGASYIPLDPALPAEKPLEGLDWNLWVGPAQWHPYNSAYHRNPIPGVVPWVFCEAFGAGAITSYHSHAADVLQYAIGMETTGPFEIYHPSSGQFPTLSCRYANGVHLHHIEDWNQVKSLYHAVPADARIQGMFGALFVGERGWITALYGAGGVEAGPASLLREMSLTTRQVNMGGNNHHANWFQCIRSRALPSSHEEIGHRSASLGHQVATSFQLKRNHHWDPVQEVFLGDNEANRLLSRARREPWQA